MNKLTVVAKFKARTGKEDQLKAELMKLVKPTRSEQGCLQYDLHQDQDDPAVFLFFENWEGEAELAKHLQSNHIKEFAIVKSDLVEEFIINKMSLV